MDDKQSSDAAFEEVKVGGKCPFAGDTVGGAAG